MLSQFFLPKSIIICFFSSGDAPTIGHLVLSGVAKVWKVNQKHPDNLSNCRKGLEGHQSINKSIVTIALEVLLTGGPSGLLDFVFCAVWELRPCDLCSGVVIG